MKNIITFTDITGFVDKEYYPKPASVNIPTWYKDTPSYAFGKKEIYKDSFRPQTIKRCMPVFDAMTAGYILYTYVDIYVRTEDNMPYYSWAAHTPIEWHPREQFEKYPRLENRLNAPKFLNPFSIKTPKGYSTLFVPPIHQDKSPFKILEGIVDTDNYSVPVNFPFLLNDDNFNGLIPAGTPMAQAIPIKRDKWTHAIGNYKEIKESEQQFTRMKVKFFDAYKTLFRATKEYK